MYINRYICIYINPYINIYMYICTKESQQPVEQVNIHMYKDNVYIYMSKKIQIMSYKYMNTYTCT